MSRELLFLAIVALILVESTHLKWIWWNYWVCRHHARVRKECGCSGWVMFLSAAPAGSCSSDDGADPLDAVVA